MRVGGTDSRWRVRLSRLVAEIASSYNRLMLAAEGYPRELVWSPAHRTLVSALPHAPGVVVYRIGDNPPTVTATVDVASAVAQLVARKVGGSEVAVVLSSSLDEAAAEATVLRRRFVGSLNRR